MRRWRQVARPDIDIRQIQIEKKAIGSLCRYVEDRVVWVHHGPVVEHGAEDGGFGGGEFVGEGFFAEEEGCVAAALEGEGF
jgi:hypothetical protein